MGKGPLEQIKPQSLLLKQQLPPPPNDPLRGMIEFGEQPRQRQLQPHRALVDVDDAVRALARRSHSHLDA
jgi:hypothetical protein